MDRLLKNIQYPMNFGKKKVWKKKTIAIGSIPKGQLISKGLMLSSNSSKKWTNEFGFFAEQYYDRIVLFIFWRNSRIGKSHFEINWPLVVETSVVPTVVIKENQIWSHKHSGPIVQYHISFHKWDPCWEKMHSTITIYATDCDNSTKYWEILSVNSKIK
jgi:hypothetical protein